MNRYDLPMNSKRVNNDRSALRCRLVAEAFYQDQDCDCLLVSQACVDRNINVVGMHRDIRRDDTVERRYYGRPWNIISDLSEHLEDSPDFGCECIIDV